MDKKIKKIIIMTTEQKELLIKDLCAKLPYGVKDPTKVGSNIKVSLEDWLNKNHFDYRGLIEMGSKKEIKKLLLLSKKVEKSLFFSCTIKINVVSL